jgi:hypothetical protein
VARRLRERADRDHFQMAVDDLSHARLLWGSHVERLITDRLPFTEFRQALTRHEPNEIKVVLEWNR